MREMKRRREEEKEVAVEGKGIEGGNDNRKLIEKRGIRAVFSLYCDGHER